MSASYVGSENSSLAVGTEMRLFCVQVCCRCEHSLFCGLQIMNAFYFEENCDSDVFEIYLRCDCK